VRVERVEAIPVAIPEPNDFGAVRHLTLVKLTADDGRVGWGEAVTTWPEANAATAKVIEGLAPLVAGRDPVESDAIWDDLRQHTFWYGHGGIASFAISALDIAVWDLKGKTCGQPLVNLLGGAVHERLPTIISAHAHKEDLGEMAEEVAGWLEQGHHGYKFGMGKRGNARLGVDHERDVEFVRLIREAIGPDKWIMPDNGYYTPWDLRSALRRIKAWEEYDVRWVEEPLDQSNLHGYRVLREHVQTMLAFGEREWNVRDYERLVRTGLVDVVGVDPGRVEGVTACRKIVERIEAERCYFNAHAWSSAIVSAVSLALTAASTASLLFEIKPLPNPMQDELVAEPLQATDGWISAPTAPGLGIEVLEDAVRRYRVDV
jgi:L-alanine-DL-glutamate epimerase-like enolase superfamily enzyme